MSSSVSTLDSRIHPTRNLTSNGHVVITVLKDEFHRATSVFVSLYENADLTDADVITRTRETLLSRGGFVAEKLDHTSGLGLMKLSKIKNKHVQDAVERLEIKTGEDSEINGDGVQVWAMSNDEMNDRYTCKLYSERGTRNRTYVAPKK